MESERVKDRTKVAPTETGGESGEGVSARPDKRKGRDSVTQGEGEKRGESSRSARPPTSARPAQSSRPSPSSATYTSARKGKQRDPNPNSNSRSRSSYPNATFADPSHPSPPKRQRALSPIPISHPMPLTELRQLKKEAFAKYHPPGGGGGVRAGSGTGGGGGGARSASAALGKSTSGSMFGRGSDSGGKFGFGFGIGGKSKSQPNMGAKMGLLLERIQRDRGA